MDKGRLRFGFAMTGSYIHAEHDVEPHQWEPGLPASQQAASHVLDIGMMEWDLDAQIGLHERFAFEAFLPIRANVINASFKNFDGAEIPGFHSIHHRDEVIYGLGDLVLGGRIALVLPENVVGWNLDLRLGFSQPTGKIEPDPFALGEAGHDHQHMFFGSGTYDPFAGLESRHAFRRWLLAGWFNARVPLYRNRFEYRASRVVVAGVGAASGFGLQRVSFLLQPEVYYETPAVWANQNARNSGRTSLIATLGVFMSASERWQIYVLGKIPYYTRSKGGQLLWPFVAIAGVSFSFDLLEHDHEHHEGDGHDH